MIKSGVSRVGGKFRSVNTLREYTPSHDYFFSGFLGSGIYEINKPRCKFEAFNDIDSELINYFLMIREYPKEFNELKQGVFGLVSQEIFNRIVSGELKPQNDIERAYFFFYLNKCAFGGSVPKGYREIKPLNASITPNYRGISPKSGYRDITPMGGHKNESGYCGVNIKTTRPFTNNDMGILSPLEPKCIKRLQYTNITSYPFDKAYKMFEKGLLKKDITDSVFMYFDPPYVGTEKYYGTGFGKEEHDILLDILLNTKFKFMLSMGGDCEFYLDTLEDCIIKELKVKYSTDANSQKESTEWLIMNYDITKLPKMIMSSNQKTLEVFQ